MIGDNNHRIISPYKENRVLSKLSYIQLEALMPIVPESDYILKPYVSYIRNEVVIEFPHYVELILKHVDLGFISSRSEKEIIKIDEESKFAKHERVVETKEGNNSRVILISYGNMIDDAKVVKKLIETLFNFMTKVKEKSKSKLDRDDYNKLLQGSMNVIHSFIKSNGESLVRLWQSFILNVALMNFRSVILCAENSNKDQNTLPLVPIRFYPKLGSELSIVFPDETNLTMEQVKERMITGELEINDIEIEFLISSLKHSELDSFLDKHLMGKMLHIQKYADKFGYTSERYRKAEEVIIASSSFSSQQTIEDCEDYLDDHLDLISTLTALCSEHVYLNKNLVYILLDFKLN